MAESKQSGCLTFLAVAIAFIAALGAVGDLDFQWAVVAAIALAVPPVFALRKKLGSALALITAAAFVGGGLGAGRAWEKGEAARRAQALVEAQAEEARKEREAEQARLDALGPEERAAEQKRKEEERQARLQAEQARREQEEQERQELEEEKRRLEAGLLGLAWIYDSSEDAMGRGAVKTAARRSVNTIELGFPYGGPQRGMLTLRKHPRHGQDVIVRIERGQILCRSYEDCIITVRFGDKKPSRFSAVGSSDNDSTVIFIRNYKRFLQGLRKVDRVRIELPLYREGNRVLEFQVSKLEWK